MEFALGLAIGAALVWIAVFIRDTKKNVGYLRVDHSDPDSGPYLFLELTKPMPEIQKQKTVILEVKLEDYLTQK